MLSIFLSFLFFVFVSSLHSLLDFNSVSSTYMVFFCSFLLYPLTCLACFLGLGIRIGTTWSFLDSIVHLFSEIKEAVYSSEKRDTSLAFAPSQRILWVTIADYLFYLASRNVSSLVITIICIVHRIVTVKALDIIISDASSPFRDLGGSI